MGSGDTVGHLNTDEPSNNNDIKPTQGDTVIPKEVIHSVSINDSGNMI